MIDRKSMVSQVPILRAQIRSLRMQASTAFDLHSNGFKNDRIGHALTSIMLAGFALELGLKQFFMAYRSTVPREHDLYKLFGLLPPKMRDDISRTYAASTFERPELMAIALRLSAHRPNPPQNVPASNYDTAEEVVRCAANAFTKSRYFFERINNEVWTTIDFAVPYMLALSETFDVVFDGYKKAGRWSS